MLKSVPLLCAALSALLCASLYAQEGPPPPPSGRWVPPGWQDRRQHFWDTREQNQGAVVFLGDSITQGWKSLEKDFPEHKIANLGISGDLAGNLTYRLQDAIDLKPSALVLMIGSNDIKDGRKGADLAATVEKLLTTFHKEVPDAPVALCLVMPRAARSGQPKEAEHLPGGVVAANEALTAMAGRLPWVKVYDTFTPLAQPDNLPIPAMFTDGVHPSSAGYKAWKAVIEPFMAEIKAPK